MICDDIFLVTKTKGSILHRGNGEKIVLDKVPENALELWKEGSDVIALRKTGSSILEKLSKAELEAILEKRLPHGINVELLEIKKALKNAK